jgi:oligoribonuclease NrnB/cAMP/cGMP phosphodiesterase (DHH superfamily)
VIRGKKVYHLSHIDLDGYSCQLITKRCFEHIAFYNSNYGKEINERIYQIIKRIEFEKYEESLILITDVNLTLDQADFLVKSVEESEQNIEILLLDHHKTGQDCANKYAWYHLDVSRCATKITYDYFLNAGYAIADMQKYVDVVNAIDIWLKDSEYFELGKVCMRLVSHSKEVNRMLFSGKNSDYIFHLLQRAQEFFEVENPHIALDNSVHALKKSFFQVDEDNTLENLVSHFIVDMLSKNSANMTIHYHDKRGILTYSIGNVSIIGNDFLVKNPEFDFFMDINGRGNVSLRANNNADVSALSKRVFNGGGHANASGGRFEGFKDSFIYDDIIEQVQDKLTVGENS